MIPGGRKWVRHLRANNPLDLPEAIQRYLAKSAVPYAPLALGDAQETGNTLSYVMTPAGDAKRYYDGRIRRKYSFQINAKHKQSIEAIQQLNRIMYAMEGAARNSIVSANGSFVFLRAKMTGSPNQIGIWEDDGGDYAVYAGAFQVEVILN